MGDSVNASSRSLSKRLREATGIVDSESSKKTAKVEQAKPRVVVVPGIEAPVESTEDASSKAVVDANAERVVMATNNNEYPNSSSGVVKQKRKLCEEEGCTVQPSYNFEGERTRRFCKKHKHEGMVLTASLMHAGTGANGSGTRSNRKVCEHEGCNTQPSYNYANEKGRRFCKGHKLENMVDVSNKLCEEDGCAKQAACNFLGQKRRFCNLHKQEGMEDLVNKRCAHEGCTKGPSYNFPGQKRKFCTRHKEEGMVDVYSRKCEEEGCNKQPSYNFQGVKLKRFCNAHKLEGMVCTH